jgi:hypothetical protein
MSKIRWVGYLLTGVLAVGALTAFAWKPVPPAKFLGLSDAQVPMNFGTYHGVKVPVDAVTQAALPSADIIERQYTCPNGDQITATIIGGTGRNQLHDPRSCLVGAGWQIENDHVERLPDTTGDIPVRSCQVSAQSSANSDPSNSSSNTDIIYLYVVNRKIVASASSIRWTLLKSDLLEQTDEPVYYIRTLMSMPPLTDGMSARSNQHRQLTQFTAALWKKLSPVIDQGERL